MFLFLIVVLLIVLWGICLIFIIWLAHAIMRQSSLIFVFLSQIVRVSYLDNFSSKMQNHCFAIPKSSNFVINTIFAMLKIRWAISIVNI